MSLEITYRLSSSFMTILVVTNSKGYILEVAPIAKWSLGKHISKLIKYMNKDKSLIIHKLK